MLKLSYFLRKDGARKEDLISSSRRAINNEEEHFNCASNLQIAKRRII